MKEYHVYDSVKKYEDDQYQIYFNLTEKQKDLMEEQGKLIFGPVITMILK